MGEQHIKITDRRNYDEIIEKQKQIIDTLLSKPGNLHFYSESPCDMADKLMTKDGISSCIVAQYANSKQIPLHFSKVTLCDRKEGMCDQEYAKDIYSIFNEKPETSCLVAAVGLLHVSLIKEMLELLYEENNIQIIIVNTVSNQFLSKYGHLLSSKEFDLQQFLKEEPGYTLPGRAEYTKPTKYDPDGIIENEYPTKDEDELEKVT